MIEVTITKEDFDKFMKVRNSGLTNMFDADTVSRLSKLDKGKVRHIIHNFDELYDKYNDKKE